MLLTILLMLIIIHNSVADQKPADFKKIIINTMDWNLCVLSDGSGLITYGSDPSPWRTGSAAFDLGSVVIQLHPLLEKNKNVTTFKNPIGIYIPDDLLREFEVLRKEQVKQIGYSDEEELEGLTGMYMSVENSEEIRNLFRKALENVDPAFEDEIRECIRHSPPFGIQDTEMKIGQTEPSQGKNIASGSEAIHPASSNNASPRQKIDSVQNAARTRERADTSQPAHWKAVVAGLIAVMVGLTWLLLRKKNGSQV